MKVVKDFVRAYGYYADISQVNTGVPALFTLAQGALESGWGKNVKGNNFFGVKDTDGINGNEILILTTEYNQKTGWRKVKAWFRKYNTPADSFTDHGKFLRKNPRYREAFNFTNDPVRFAHEVAAAGYATDPKYDQKIQTIMKMIKPYFKPF